MLVANVASRNLHAQLLTRMSETARGVYLDVDADDFALRQLQLALMSLNRLEIGR